MEEGDKKCILAVDDEEDLLKLYEMLFRGEGYKIMLAKDGKQAIECIQKNPNIQIILLDIIMPGMTGFEVYDWIKNQPKYNQIPVIFISCATREQNEHKALELGAVAYISKPFNSQILLETVKKNLFLQKN